MQRGGIEVHCAPLVDTVTSDIAPRGSYACFKQARRRLGEYRVYYPQSLRISNTVILEKDVVARRAVEALLLDVDERHQRSALLCCHVLKKWARRHYVAKTKSSEVAQAEIERRLQLALPHAV